MAPEADGLRIVEDALCFGGRMRSYAHRSDVIGADMAFAVFVPKEAEHTARPVLWWLSGLTCTPANFSQKAGAQRVAAELGIILAIPDTSPRGPDVPGDPDGSFDFGHSAGFYLDATRPPWSRDYRMYSYLTTELPRVLASAVAADMTRQSIMGHSMGGHGALTLGLKHPERFRSVSAFAPICNPMRSPWGRKAFLNYLGPEEDAWRPYDACALVEDGRRVGEILVDQGLSDPWLAQELLTDHFEAVCALQGQPLVCRRQAGYDHGFFFISTFIEDHLRWHAERLNAPVPRLTTGPRTGPARAPLA